MRRALATATLFAAVLAAPATAQTTVYSTFGPGNSYYFGSGWTIGGPFDDLAVAAGFTYAGPGGMSLFDLSFAAFSVYNTPILAEFVSGDINSGTVLESWNVAPPLDGIYTLTSLLNPGFTNGESYFLRLSGPPNETWWAWNWNDQGYTGLWSSDDGSAYQYTQGAAAPTLAVRAITSGPGSTVPEPATMTLLATGLAGIAASRRRQRA